MPAVDGEARGAFTAANVGRRSGSRRPALQACVVAKTWTHRALRFPGLQSQRFLTKERSFQMERAPFP
eukprot:10988325-Lingulodinium_polyedra.AAC.1